MDVLLGNKNVIIDDDADYIPPSATMPELIVDIKKEPIDPTETNDPPPPGTGIATE